MAQLDSRILLSSIPLPSPAEMADERQKREIQQQEVDLRRQEILQRRDALIEAARQRQQKAAPAWDPKKAKEATDYQLFLGQTVADKLRLAQQDPSTYPYVRQMIGQIAGPEAMNELPEDWETAAPIVAQHVATWPEHAAALKAESGFTLSEGQTRFGPNGEQIATVPKPEKPTADTGDLTKSGLDVQAAAALARGDMDAYNRLLKVKKEMGRADDKPPAAAVGVSDDLIATVMANPSLYATLPPTTKKNLIPALGKLGFDFAASGGGKPPTKDQSDAAGYARRVEESEDTLKAVQKDISGMGLISFAAQSHLPPKGQSSAFQQYDQASRNFINAVLRRESGAAISNSEFDNARRQYLPQPGDAPETLELKRKNRETTLGNLIAAGGPAYKARSASVTPPGTPKKVGRFTVEEVK